MCKRAHVLSTSYIHVHIRNAMLQLSCKRRYIVPCITIHFMSLMTYHIETCYRTVSRHDNYRIHCRTCTWDDVYD